MTFPSWTAPRWLLLASLCLNAVLISYVSIQWLRPPVNTGAMITPYRMVERVAARLPKNDADIVWEVFRSKEAELRPLQAGYIRGMAKTIRVVAAPELDKAALRAAAKEARDQRELIGDKVIEIFLESLERISPQGRQQLVRGLPR